MIRRSVGAAAAVAASLVLLAAPAAAHGIGGRVDLPVPRWLFVFGAASVLVVSFALLGALWREPRFPRPAPVGRDSVWQTFVRDPVVEWVVRAIGLAWFLVVVVAGLLPGRTDATIAPVAILIWFWVGLAFLQALLGDWWATLSPFDTLGRLLGLDYAGGDPPRRYPTALGTWPATVGLFLFTWMELVDPFRSAPGSLGVLVVLYTAVQVAGMARFGREAWIRGGETFAVHLGLIARLSPLRRDVAGRIVVASPLARLPEVEPRPGLLSLVLVALGTTTFDGFSRTTWWLERTAVLDGAARVAAGTAGLLVAVLIVGAAYALAMRAAAGAGGDRRALSDRFAHTLVPIVVAYLVAHYASYLVIEGQIGLARISDPFGFGWDLFGTATRTVNLEIVSPQLIWYVQVAAIVLGHVAGVVLAHDLALRLFPEGAMRTQSALLAVMVLFTAGGLLILSA